MTGEFFEDGRHWRAILSAPTTLPFPLTTGFLGRMQKGGVRPTRPSIIMQAMLLRREHLTSCVRGEYAPPVA